MVEGAAKLLLDSAKRDERAFRALVAIPEMNDAVIGFHAHQCIEKALKAALAHSRIAFRRTHAIAELIHENRTNRNCWSRPKPVSISNTKFSDLP